MPLSLEETPIVTIVLAGALGAPIQEKTNSTVLKPLNLLEGRTEQTLMWLAVAGWLLAEVSDKERK